MPLYMDIHDVSEDITPEMVRDAHRSDVEVQGKYGVNYRGYWFDTMRRKVFCLVEGPSPEACSQVHREAYGQGADRIIKVSPEHVLVFMGSANLSSIGEAFLPDGSRDPGLRVVLVTQIDNLVAVGNGLGDAAAMQVLDCHDRLVRGAVVNHGGREVQHLGDGIMACFTAASAAVQCALEIQRSCRQAADTGPAPALRIGMAAGEPVEQHENLFGVTVEQARAIARAANPGGISASTVVRELCAGKGLTFAPAAAVRIPGIDQPLALASVVDPNGTAARHTPARGTAVDQRERLARALAHRYEIERELGQGGMATIYLARDLKHDRRVAIKALRAELAALLGTQRFLQEIRVAARLAHPHIVPLYDSGEAHGILYYVMPHLEGQTLRALIEQERELAIDRAVDIARRVAVALDYAHRQGVVHRDIKPDNVLLHEGQPMVLDFGIALALSQAAGDRLTEPGISVGTPAYMSPEQAAGDRDIDGRTDVYALGCMLYEMLAGETPFTASGVQAMIAKILADRPTPISRLRGGVPNHVERAVHRALAKAPADRFPSAAEFAEALAG